MGTTKFYTRNEINRILCGIGVDSWNRFETFLSLIPRLKGENYWYALRIAYERSDNLYHMRGLVKAAFLRTEPGRDALMNSEEREYLKNLPDNITIYRGMTETELQQKDFGISWTLKHEVAEFFAQKYWRNISTNHHKKTVHKLTIDKGEVITFLNDRDEFEIIYIKP